MTQKKAIVLLSGGMDSLVTAALAHHENHELYFLHASYGQRTQEKELESFAKISSHYQAKATRIVDLAWLKELGSSSLIDPAYQSLDGEAAKSFPDTYVPFRNANLLCIAVAWAEAISAEHIYIGVVEEDSSGYPDCSKSFIQAMQELIDTASGASHKIYLHAPVIDKDKSQIVSLGLSLNAPFEHSWSCYFANDAACGQCDSCRLRLRAFAKASHIDPIKYQGGKL